MMAKYIAPYLRWPVALGVVGVPLLLIFMWPMSWWLDIRTVHVNDAVFGQDITMLVDRDVKRDFYGTFSVTVYRWTNNGPEAYCSVKGREWDYKTGAVYPVPLTLYWWTDHDVKCSHLPPGQYQITTRWVNLSSLLPLPSKTLTVTSNIFTVSR